MAKHVRNPEWENDEALRIDPERYVRQKLWWYEILDFVKLQYPIHAWSLRSLACRMQFFQIKYTDYEVEVEEVKTAVQKELQGPGKLLGYRAMQQKVRDLHRMNVPHGLAYAKTGEADPQGLKARGGVGQSNRPHWKNAFVSGVSNSLYCEIKVFNVILAL